MTNSGRSMRSAELIDLRLGARAPCPLHTRSPSLSRGLAPNCGAYVPGALGSMRQPGTGIRCASLAPHENGSEPAGDSEGCSSYNFYVVDLTSKKRRGLAGSMAATAAGVLPVSPKKGGAGAIDPRRSCALGYAEVRCITRRTLVPSSSPSAITQNFAAIRAFSLCCVQTLSPCCRRVNDPPHEEVVFIRPLLGRASRITASWPR
jgi:hypothetical protein